MPAIRKRMIAAVTGAARVFAVSDSLRRLALDLGVAGERALVVSNGVDMERFRPLPRAEARRQLGIPADARVLVTVGGLVARKGYHRVIECLPRLRQEWGDVVYLAVGGASKEGDDSKILKAQAATAGVGEHVKFLGPLAPDTLSVPLSAADALVLASSNEGWANVLLEAMACGTPVVASDVGGNREVVADESVGLIFDLADAHALEPAIDQVLRRQWDRDAIVAFAGRNSWQSRVDRLVDEFIAIAADRSLRKAPENLP